VKQAPTAQKRNVLLRFRKAIEAGKFAAQGLPKEVNEFFAAHHPLLPAQIPAVLEKLFTSILDRYALSGEDDDAAPADDRAPRPIINPTIVLTVSFGPEG
jgi:hypothetical protein